MSTTNWLPSVNLLLDIAKTKEAEDLESASIGNSDSTPKKAEADLKRLVEGVDLISAEVVGKFTRAGLSIEHLAEFIQLQQ